MYDSIIKCFYRGDILRKKIVMFIIIVAVVCGFMVGLKKVKIEPKEIVPNDISPTIVNEIYRDELNLPISEIDTLNPLNTKNIQVASALSFIYEPLISYKSNEEIEGVLAYEWAKIDSHTWIITLRDNVNWHGGENFTANDVIFTFDVLMNNDFTYSSNMKNVKEIEKISNNSIKIILNEKDDFFINKLTFPIIPEFYFRNDELNNDYKLNRPIGTGPYKYSNTDVNENIKLEFNSSWWKENDSKLKSVNLYKYATYGEAVKAFKSVEVDLIVTNMSEWKEKFGTIGVNAYSFENSEYEVIIPNCNNASLSENSVRRAILQGINRENIINSIYYDNASISDIPIHTNSKYSIGNAEYDLEKAKQILINAGWEQKESGWQKEINGNIQVLSFNLLVNSGSEKKMAVAEKIKNDLAELGIKITVTKTSIDNIKKYIEQDKFDLVLTSFDIKNEVMIQECVSKDNSSNYSNYNSENMENLIAKLKIDDYNYNENMYTFAQLYKNDAPYIGLYFKTSTILTNKSVKGIFEPTWSNYFRNITSFCK